MAMATVSFGLACPATRASALTSSRGKANFRSLSLHGHQYTARVSAARRAVQVRAKEDDDLQVTIESRDDIPVTDGDSALNELTKDDFYQYLESAGNLVVVDFYTDWCGPCKMIYPTLVEMNSEMDDVDIVKFNCNKYNKDLGKELGIRVAPTFHLYKGGAKVAEMTGAKVDALKELIAQNK